MYLLYKIGRFLAVVLPLKISYGIACLLGRLYFILAKRDRKIAYENMNIVLKQSVDARRIRQITCAVFTNFGRYLVEFFHSSEMDIKFMKKNVTMEGRDNLDKALSLSKGVLLISAHLGNWELGAMFLSMLGYKMNIVAWAHTNKQIKDLFLRLRQNKGVKVIPLGAAVRKVFKALKNNELIALLGDIDYLQPDSGLTVKFFGEDTVMPKGPALFSLRTGAPIVPTFFIREANGKFRMIFEQPILNTATEFSDSALISLTQRLTKTMEFYIAQYPEQWFMLTTRWKQSR